MNPDPKRSTYALLLIMALIGGSLWFANRNLPLVRNSLVYARASENVIAHDYDPRPVVADSKLSYDKPILYPWVSAPFVRVLGNHDGLRATSFATTLGYLIALVYFARAFRSRLPQESETLMLWLCALGPCVFYQFWSAHPDGWFAALVLFAWGMSERIVSEPGVHTVRRVIVLGCVIYVAILLKNYGLVLLISCPLYLAWHWRRWTVDRAVLRRFSIAFLFVFGAIGALVLLAWTGHNALSRLEGEGGGVGQYATGELGRSAHGTWVQLGLALALQFQIALCFAFHKSAWSRRLLAPLISFAVPYIACLMPFPTTFYNMRYFIPIFALAGLVFVCGASAMQPKVRRAILAAHGALGCLLILVFNVAPMYRWAKPALPELEVNWIGVPLSLLDNLRMRLHLEEADVLARIDRDVPHDATLYMLDVNYYRDAQQGVYERAGLIRSDISTHYVSSRGFDPTERDFYVFSQRAPQLESLGRVTRLEDYLFHVER